MCNHSQARATDGSRTALNAPIISGHCDRTKNVDNNYIAHCNLTIIIIEELRLLSFIYCFSNHFNVFFFFNKTIVIGVSGFL